MNSKLLYGGMVALLLGVLSLSPATASTAAIQTTTFINVGQGDSALIRDGLGFDVLIDGGKPDAGPTVLDYLRSQGVTELDVMLASHADSDHIGGLIDVLQASDITVLQVLYNGYPGDTATWATFVSAVTAEGLTLTPIQFPADLTWGTMQAHILNPEAGLINPETNDASIVIRLDYGVINYLFTGDIDSTIEATVVARQTPVASEILKVAHHGSAYSSSNEFLAAADPTLSAISVGVNSYGHPSPLTIERLINSGSQVLRTDEYGNITVYSDGSFISLIEPPLGYSVYLPFIMISEPPVEPTPETPTPTTPTPVTPTPVTPTPTESTPPVIPTTGNIVIVSIFYDGVNGTAEPDEYVQIQNQDTTAIQVQNWTLRDVANHVFTFPNYVMQPGQSCRIYTNINDPGTCGFNYGSGAAIWNNGGDTAYLRDSTGALISQRAY
ncbi:MAG: hypothetical protein A2X80_10010 [Geobacteraceae bacterium GWB2_52_12]|nr:MAG: hypothetical protein A2X80_10010 [Geobacteraceae bacterium GWB2_52_12]